ncbi:MAG: SsrA-binding protein SmpB [Actinomycetota bacterium]|nr:SsrA-binding protein SmpB [Actinomycetota bacterium]
MPARRPTTAAEAKAGPAIKTVAKNRRARHDYDILEVHEAGIALVGTEVKSLREGHVQLKDAYARPEDGELWLVGVHVSPYAQADGFGGHDPERRRKLLLHRDEIADLSSRVTQEALTLVPLSVYFKNGKAKVELGLARGRRRYDKRIAIAARDAQRDTDRALAVRHREGAERSR